MVDVGSEDRLNQALAKLKEARQEIEAFSMETNDKNSEKLYKEGAKQINQVISSVSGRSDYIEKQNDEEKSQAMDLE